MSVANNYTQFITKKDLIMFRKFILLIGLILIVSSCRTITEQYNTVYKPSIEKRNGIPQGESLFVAELIDERPIDEQNPFDQNDPLILIPLWPYSYAEVNPVIKYSYFQAGIRDSLTKLIAKDLSASELFKQFKFAKKEDNPPETPKIDEYKLILRLKKATWKRYLTSYGLSYAGMYLWFFLPKSYGSVELKIEATLRAPKTNRIIADILFTDTQEATEWTYDQMNYQPPISVFAMERSFPKMMKSIRKMLLESLKDKNNSK